MILVDPPHGLESNAGSFLLASSPVGIIGFGDLGRALRRLLVPFRCPITVFELETRARCCPAGPVARS